MQSYTIITTDPNSITAQVHNRMPVILRLQTTTAGFSARSTHPKNC
jgi:putative SOS response-associated peptidase YedK